MFGLLRVVAAIAVAVMATNASEYEYLRMANPGNYCVSPERCSTGICRNIRTFRPGFTEGACCGAGVGDACVDCLIHDLESGGPFYKYFKGECTRCRKGPWKLSGGKCVSSSKKKQSKKDGWCSKDHCSKSGSREGKRCCTRCRRPCRDSALKCTHITKYMYKCRRTSKPTAQPTETILNTYTPTTLPTVAEIITTVPVATPTANPVHQSTANPTDNPTASLVASDGNNDETEE